MTCSSATQEQVSQFLTDVHGLPLCRAKFLICVNCALNKNLPVNIPTVLVNPNVMKAVFFVTVPMIKGRKIVDASLTTPMTIGAIRGFKLIPVNSK